MSIKALKEWCLWCFAHHNLWSDTNKPVSLSSISHCRVWSRRLSRRGCSWPCRCTSPGPPPSRCWSSAAWGYCSRRGSPRPPSPRTCSSCENVENLEEVCVTVVPFLSDASPLFNLKILNKSNICPVTAEECRLIFGIRMRWREEETFKIHFTWDTGPAARPDHETFSLILQKYSTGKREEFLRDPRQKQQTNSRPAKPSLWCIINICSE